MWERAGAPGEPQTVAGATQTCSSPHLACAKALWWHEGKWLWHSPWGSTTKGGEDAGR